MVQVATSESRAGTIGTARKNPGLRAKVIAAAIVAAIGATTGIVAAIPRHATPPRSTTVVTDARLDAFQQLKSEPYVDANVQRLVAFEGLKNGS